MREFRPPRLIGLRLEQGRYREIPFETMPNGKRGLRSARLNLYACDGGGRLRWFDPTSGDYLRTYAQLDRERREAEQRQRAAEAELTRLREELRQGGRDSD